MMELRIKVIYVKKHDIYNYLLFTLMMYISLINKSKILNQKSIDLVLITFLWNYYKTFFLMILSLMNKNHYIPWRIIQMYRLYNSFSFVLASFMLLYIIKNLFDLFYIPLHSITFNSTNISEMNLISLKIYLNSENYSISIDFKI